MINNIPAEWINNLDKLLSNFNLKARDYSKYFRAFTHSSYSFENKLNYNYERYEFIGDSTISWIVCSYLFNSQKYDEGRMSEIKSKLVESKTLAAAANKLSLGKLLWTGKGLQTITSKILEDVYEAFIGVVLDDIDLEAATKIVNETILVPFEKGQIDTNKPYKTLIQEFLMRSSSNEIKYVIKSETTNLIKVNLIFNNCTYGQGIGKTLREAEEDAAKDAYLKSINNK